MQKKYVILLSLINAHAQDWRINVWQPTHFIWNFGISLHADKGLEPSPLFYFQKEPSFNTIQYADLKNGDIVWIKCKFLHLFYKNIFPNLRNPIVLIINDGDESFPSQSGCTKEQIEHLLSSDNIIHIFAQNCEYAGNSQKVSHLPIGMDFHTIAYKSVHGGWGEIGTPQAQEATLQHILSQLLPTHLRKKKAFVDFHLSDSMHGEYNRYLQFGEDRTSIFNRLITTGLIDYSSWMKRTDLWKTKGQYAFSISPHGNGLDCHRTWEDLILGCIVIVKTSVLDPLYQGLPVVIVKDWNEITEQNMNKWLEQYHDAFTNPTYREKLTNQYWLNKINILANLHK